MVQARAGASQAGQSRICLGSWRGEALCLWPGVLHSPLAPGAATTLTQEHPPVLPLLSSALRPPEPPLLGGLTGRAAWCLQFLLLQRLWGPAASILVLGPQLPVPLLPTSFWGDLLLIFQTPLRGEPGGHRETVTVSPHPASLVQAGLAGAMWVGGAGPPWPCLGLSIPIFKAEAVGDGGDGALCGGAPGFCGHLTPGCLLVVEGILRPGGSNLRMGQDPLSPSSSLDPQT